MEIVDFDELAGEPQRWSELRPIPRHLDNRGTPRAGQRWMDSKDHAISSVDPNLTGRIRHLRGQAVLLDSDLARLYGVPTKRLNEQVKRNRARFPEDFMFRLTKEEAAALRSQIATSKAGRGGRHGYEPLAFTEQGVAMLSSVLHSERAILVNIEIMRVFVALRRLAATHTDLTARLDGLEQKYDAKFKAVFQVLRALVVSPSRSKVVKGFGDGE